MKLLKKISLLTILSVSLFGNSQPDLSILQQRNEPKIRIKNTVLAKIHGKTITVMDLIKKMDYAFYHSYPDLIESDSARYQFYTMSWKHLLDESINTQLILADAESKELKTSDSEIRKQMGEQFGPNILITLDKMGLSYDDAWNMVKDELTVQKMSWFRVNSKALQKITPENIRKAYKDYCAANPSQKTWKYQVISVRNPDETQAKQAAETIYQLCSDTKKSPELIRSQIEESTEKSSSIQISDLNEAADDELSKTYKKILTTLKNNSYSPPVLQQSKSSSKSVYRIFYLQEVNILTPPSFDEIANKLEQDLLQQAMAQESSNYVQKLRSYYEYEHQKIELPDHFEPFVIE